MFNNKKIFWIIIVVLAGAAAAAGLSFFKKSVEVTEEETQLRQVITSPIELTNLSRTISGQGMVESSQTLTLHSQVSAEVVYSLGELRDGVTFKEGDLLLQLESTQVESQLQIAETALLKSLSSLISNLSSEDLQQKWSGFRSAILAGIQPDMPKGNTEWERLYISQFGIPDGYYQWKELIRLKSLYRFTAPFNGQINSPGYPRGSLLFQGQQIATLQNPRYLQTRLALTLEETRYLEESEHPVIRIYPEEGNSAYLTGSILRMSGELDSRTQTRNVYIGFENLENLMLPGSFCHIEIEGDPVEEALLLTRDLLNQDSSINILQAGKLKKIPVIVEGYRDDRVILTGSELQNGQELIETRLQIALEGIALEKLEEAEEL